MNATIITIGDEILLGQTVDTNSAWIATQLTDLGIQVYEIISIGDEKAHILNALHRASNQSTIVLITGGLGPTNDDITKKTLAEYFGVEMEFRQEILDNIAEIFSNRGRVLLERNRSQADVPVNSLAIKNHKGTAPGMWFFESDKYYISMPGVPREMKSMMELDFLPKLKRELSLPLICYRHVLTAGIPESVLAEKMIDFEKELPSEIKMAYLPSLSKVKIRLTINGQNESELKEKLKKQISKIESIIPGYIYGFDNENMEENIGKLLMDKNVTVSTAESCTGGNIAHRITKNPGSSAYFLGSIVSYSNELKMGLLGVKNETLDQKGAVSEETVVEMVAGALNNMNSDYAIAVSGIAGPGGGTKEKPVGTVWIAVGNKEKTIAKKFQLTNNRLANIEISTVLALEMLRKFLCGLIGNDLQSG